MVALWGVLADRTRYRRTFMVNGLIILAAATVLSCFMTNLTMLLIGRILQGLTSSLTWTVGLASVVDTSPPGRLGQAMGWVSLAHGLASQSSPLLGGVIYGTSGYYSVWAICFSLIGVDIILRLVVIEKRRAAHHHAKTNRAHNSLDFRHRINTTEISDLQSLHDNITLRKARSSMRRCVGPFLNARILTALWSTAALAIIITAFDSTLPILVTELFGWKSIGAGLAFLPLALPALIGPLAGHICDRYGPRWLCSLGFSSTAAFLACLRFVNNDSMEHKILLCGLLAGVGLGTAFVNGPAAAEIALALNRLHEGQSQPVAMAYALHNVVFSAGALTGPLLGGYLREKVGWSTLTASLAVISHLSSILCAAFIGRTSSTASVQRTHASDSNTQLTSPLMVSDRTRLLEMGSMLVKETKCRSGRSLEPAMETRLRECYISFTRWYKTAVYFEPPADKSPPQCRIETVFMPQSPLSERASRGKSPVDFIRGLPFDGYFHIACPFYLLNPIRYKKCLTSGDCDLQNLGDLVSHLHDRHTHNKLCSYCCYDVSDVEIDQYSHMSRRDPKVVMDSPPSNHVLYTGLCHSTIREVEVKRRFNGYKSEQDQLSVIFKEIFPHEFCGGLGSQYLSDGLGYTVSLAHDFWTRRDELMQGLEFSGVRRMAWIEFVARHEDNDCI